MFTALKKMVQGTKSWQDQLPPHLVVGSKWYSCPQNYSNYSVFSFFHFKEMKITCGVCSCPEQCLHACKHIRVGFANMWTELKGSAWSGEQNWMFKSLSYAIIMKVNHICRYLIWFCTTSLSLNLERRGFQG